MRITDQLAKEWHIKLEAGDSWPADSFSVTIAGQPVNDADAVINIYKGSTLTKALTVGNGLIKDGNKFTIDALAAPLPAYKGYTHQTIVTLADTRKITIYKGTIISN